MTQRGLELWTMATASPYSPEAGLVGRGLKERLVVDVGYQVTEGLCLPPQLLKGRSCVPYRPFKKGTGQRKPRGVTRCQSLCADGHTFSSADLHVFMGMSQ